MSVEPSIHELFDLSSKVALITGATGFLGSAMPRALSEAGASVVISSRDNERAQAAAGKLTVVGAASHHGVRLDHQATRPASSKASPTRLALAGKIDILVNNGNEAQDKEWTDVTADEFTRQLANATGYFLLARLMRNHVVVRRVPASIVMLGSMYGLVGSYPDAYEGVCPASPVGYHALKGGIIHLTRHLAVYWVVTASG